ncbi:hypothetical protein M514_01427 [Trichuris suis]|uniref:Uncharacterized protein n=1 Tax=Trichuris suis TaxID=68888 RepID=A0A085N7S6_9BILA|nr:hypothetical protein M514_01427 [Trichuris suis]KHJ49443.1 hypothetical protein D918_00569 [Trichuris suis]
MSYIKFPLQKEVENYAPTVSSLQQICVKAFVQYISAVHEVRSTEELLTRLDLYLSAGIGELVMRELQQAPEVLSVEMERYDLLMNHRRMPLVTLNLSGTQLCDTCLAGLLVEHASTLTCLNIANCTRLSGKVHSLIARSVKLDNLKFLDLSGLARIFSHILFKTKHDSVRVPVVSLSDALVSFMPTQSLQLADMQKREGAVTNADDMTWSGMESDESGSSTSPGSSGSNFKMLTAAMTNLQAMIFRADIGGNEPSVEGVGKLFTELLGPISNLRYLDLSGWRHLGFMHYIESLRNLTTLVLNDVQHLDHAIDAICSVKSLMHLDLSQHNRISGEFSRPVITLDRLVRSLPLLKALDISGTNLASSPSNDDWLEADMPQAPFNYVDSDICGLRHLQKPLRFLGIFGCGVAHYRRLPAEIIAGEFSEDQVFIAIEHYLRRPLMLLKVLNEAYQLYRFESSSQHRKALEFMILVMKEHPTNVSIQIAGSACLFYILRYVNLDLINRQRVIDVLLTSMEIHCNEQTMVRNCCLSLCQFEIPNDLLLNYIRTISILLVVLEQFEDVMTQRIVVHLLNTMACHVTGAQKLTVGGLNAVEKVLWVICNKYDNNVCDEVMEVAWSFLWNITDETPENCNRFLNEYGMSVFYDCFTKFPERNELLRNMMGLVGNIAEVPSLRPRLMDVRYVSAFFKLLDNLSDGIEISYNSAGVLAHLISDGPDAWKIEDPTREEVSTRLIQTVKTWQLRSFEPIIRLLPLFESRASQYWAVWALANLTTVDGAKYCPYVVEEGGVQLLRNIQNDSRSTEDLKRLADVVLENVNASTSNDMETASSPS